jgi:hypothetical protein
MHEKKQSSKDVDPNEIALLKKDIELKDQTIHNLRIQHENEMSLFKNKISRDFEKMFEDEKQAIRIEMDEMANKNKKLIQKNEHLQRLMKKNNEQNLKKE